MADQNKTADEPLFIGSYPTGLVYADRRVSENRDYKTIAFLSYTTLKLELRKDCSKDLVTRIQDHAQQVQAKKGQKYQTSTSGQYVILGQ